MENKFKLEFNNKDILIKKQDQVVLTIFESSRTITAEQIYTMLDPKPDDTYTVEEYVRDESLGKENDVLMYFRNLLVKITDQINTINTNE